MTAEYWQLVSLLVISTMGANGLRVWHVANTELNNIMDKHINQNKDEK